MDVEVILKNKLKAALAHVRPRLLAPNGAEEVLLHSCCAPCSCEIIEAMAASGLKITIYFYNPNVHPRAEYERRKQDCIRFAGKLGIPFIDGDYDEDYWLAAVKGLEWEPEKGRRCTACFDMRFARVAKFAYENGFTVFTSSQGISRWKNMDQVNASGHRAASKYPGLIYWDYNWRKNGGANRMIEITQRENFTRQEYCGCIFSLRDTNLRRRAMGKPPLSATRSED